MFNTFGAGDFNKYKKMETDPTQTERQTEGQEKKTDGKTDRRTGKNERQKGGKKEIKK